MHYQLFNRSKSGLQSQRFTVYKSTVDKAIIYRENLHVFINGACTVFYSTSGLLVAYAISNKALITLF